MNRLNRPELTTELEVIAAIDRLSARISDCLSERISERITDELLEFEREAELRGAERRGWSAARLECGARCAAARKDVVGPLNALGTKIVVRQGSKVGVLRMTKLMPATGEMEARNSALHGTPSFDRLSERISERISERLSVSDRLSGRLSETFDVDRPARAAAFFKLDDVFRRLDSVSLAHPRCRGVQTFLTYR